MAGLSLADLAGQQLLEQHRVLLAYENDSFPDKISLTFGAYRDNEGKPWVLPVIRETITEVLQSQTLNLDYPGPYGSEAFQTAILTLMGPAGQRLAAEKKLGVVQTLGGTGALRESLELLRSIGANVLYTSSPTWPLHNAIGNTLGYEIKPYRYWDTTRLCLNWTGMLHDIQSMEKGSVILLQLCAHNPTGADPTLEQWPLIISAIKERRLFPVLDCAYLGLASGSVDVDQRPITLFLQENIEMFFAFSMSKCLGIYSERVGALVYRTGDIKTGEKVWHHLGNLALTSHLSNTGICGRVAAEIFNSKTKRRSWLSHLVDMTERMDYARRLLYNTLQELHVPGDWGHILAQKGIYCFTGLTKSQCEEMRRNHVYLYNDGRMNVSDITDNNVKQIATAMGNAVAQPMTNGFHIE